MPHAWIEYSSNIEHDEEIQTLGPPLHKAMMDSGIFPLAGIRIRLLPIQNALIADGNPRNAFVHIVLRIGHGRDEATQKRVADGIFEALTRHLAALSERRPTAIAFEVQEMHPTLNYKANSIRKFMNQDGI